MYITKKYLENHPNHIFVFGDNSLRQGKGGAASLRDEPNTYGFITKRYPSDDCKSYYNSKEYVFVFQKELESLEYFIRSNPNKTFLISKLGAGLANKYLIFENVIEPTLKNSLSHYKNVIFLY